jgi:hypothetical protein
VSDDLNSFIQVLGGPDLERIVVEEPVRHEAGRFLRNYQALITGSGGVPVDTGALRGSQEPHAGALPPIPGTAPFYGIHGADAVDRVVAGWKVGKEEIGVASQLPYSAPVMVDGHSAKFPEGRLDILIEQAVNG